MIIIILPSTGEKEGLVTKEIPLFSSLLFFIWWTWGRNPGEESPLFSSSCHGLSSSFRPTSLRTHIMIVHKRLSLFRSSKPVSMISRQSSFISYVLRRSLFFTLKRCNPLGFLCLSYTISYMSCRDEFLGSLYQLLFFFLPHFWVLQLLLQLTTFTSCMTRASLFFIWTSLWEGFTWRYFMSLLLFFTSFLCFWLSFDQKRKICLPLEVILLQRESRA